MVFVHPKAFLVLFEREENEKNLLTACNAYLTTVCLCTMENIEIPTFMANEKIIESW